MKLATNLTELLKLVRESIENSYLPENWHSEKLDGEELVLTSSGFLALEDHTIEADGEIWHRLTDGEQFGYDEIDDCYRSAEDLVEARGQNASFTYTAPDNCVEYNNRYYVTEYVEDNDLRILHNGQLEHLDYCCFVEDENEYYHTDDCFYWESDGQYHLDEEDSDNTLWEYSSGPQEKTFVNTDHEEGKEKFGFGMEIEKGEMPSFDFNKTDLHQTTGATIEKDSSVDNGFELKTPVYNLLSAKTDERLLALKNFADIKNVENAGGHIGFSMEGKTDEELLGLCRGFLPLIYAMHKRRMNNDYCTAKPISELISDGAKMQSIRMRGHYIEFRIFSSVKSFKTVLFRLSFFRILAQNIGANFSKVLLMSLNKKHPLHKLLINDVYADAQKFSRLIHDSINIDIAIGENKLTQKAINKINDRLKKLENARS